MLEKVQCQLQKVIKTYKNKSFVNCKFIHESPIQTFRFYIYYVGEME